MTLKLAIVAFTLLPFAALADASATPADPPAVSAFYRHPEHCAYMAGLPENDSPEFIKRFETDVQSAVEALRTRNPSLSLSTALVQLKAGCDRALSEVK
ncbi:hypothetical protein [Variovorax sp. GB1P17]|uniref:hypothetical protein n=1 Tax=Variovorax sp. GB1P17 TaxID=3443740 RepID=UPI003F46012F